MFGKKPQQSSTVLYFKDGQSMFECQCKYGTTEIKKGRGSIAIVTKAWTQEKTKNPCQNTMLRVADADGGFTVAAETLSMKGDLLQEGDIVVWVPERYAPAIAEAFKDPRSGWVGFVRAKVGLELDPAAKIPYRIVCRYN